MLFNLLNSVDEYREKKNQNLGFDLYVKQLLQGYWAQELIIYVYNGPKDQAEDWKASEEGKHC